MILEEKSKVEMVNPLPSMAFSIEDPVFVFKILTEKLYKNPGPTMAQEYLSNAIDACREVGSTKPVEVMICEGLLSITDYGPGLSKERVEEIFVKLGASTKRHTNRQIGGFGIGGKSAFAYTDRFKIISRVNGKRTTYLAVKDTIPKLVVGTEVHTDEPNGVTVEIPIHSSRSYEEIKDRLYLIARTSRYPIEINGELIKPEVVNLEGLEMIHTPGGIYGDVFIILGDIPYGVSLTYREKSLMRAMGVKALANINRHSKDFTPFLRFEVGEIEVTPSREDIVESRENLHKILSRLKEVQERILNRVASGDHSIVGMIPFTEIIFDFNDSILITGPYVRVEVNHPVYVREETQRIKKLQSYRFGVGGYSSSNISVVVSDLSLRKLELSDYRKFILFRSDQKIPGAVKALIESGLIQKIVVTEDHIKSLGDLKEEKKEKTVLVLPLGKDVYSRWTLSDLRKKEEEGYTIVRIDRPVTKETLCSLSFVLKCNRDIFEDELKVIFVRGKIDEGVSFQEWVDNLFLSAWGELLHRATYMGLDQMVSDLLPYEISRKRLPNLIDFRGLLSPKVCKYYDFLMERESFHLKITKYYKELDNICSSLRHHTDDEFTREVLELYIEKKGL